MERRRVAVYARVSTDSEEQLLSLETQKEHYEYYIKSNPSWEYAGMYNDCMAGKIDMVITKSISRFARNTIDCLKYVRQLKDNNIQIILEKENINTIEASGELLLTIMVSLAQQESASLSQNVKMGL